MTILDHAQYERFMDKILYAKYYLTSDDLAKLIDAKKKNGNKSGKIMKMKFDVESSIAKTCKKTAISDNTLLTFIRAEYKMYAEGRKTLVDDSLESFLSNFLRNEYIFVKVKLASGFEW